LIDTNILVYANNVDSPFHSKCKGLVEKAVNGSIQAAISIQNLIELYAVITDKRRVEHPLPPIKAKELIEFYKHNENIQVIIPTSETLTTITKLIAKHKPKAQSIFDYLLVATMMDNNIYEIYTANTDHFKPFISMKAINPISDLI
jgi:predicted nucleic acid-binding protein